MDEETDDSDSEDDKWQIMEESETELDKQLDEKSDKYSLSAINVKSIIHVSSCNTFVIKMSVAVFCRFIIGDRKIYWTFK